MKELARANRETIGPGPSGLGDIFSAYEDAGAMARVGHGPYAEELPVAEMTVGEIRARYADRFDIGPNDRAEIDGVAVAPDVRLRAGQLLQFTNRAGEKGAGAPARSAAGGVTPAVTRPPEPLVSIEGPNVVAVSREGQASAMPLAALLDAARPARIDTGGVVLPDGVKMLVSRGPYTILVHQTPPRVYQLKWIAEGSAEPFGRGAKYRTVRIALPYLIVFAVYTRGPGGRVGLGHANECFFRIESLDGPDDPLFYPALLNCSKFDPQEGRPLAWICTQHLNAAGLAGKANANAGIRSGLRALLHCLLETGFNYSSEMHEQSSWFSESARVDPRVATVEAWEKATEKDRHFVSEIPWLPVGLSVAQVAERIFENHQAGRGAIANAADVARCVANHRAGGRGAREAREGIGAGASLFAQEILL